MSYKARPAIDRFMELVEFEANSGCWLWAGSLYSNGYGRFGDYYKRVLAHRWAYERFVGALTPGLLVCHHCDTPACVNPVHLYEGTPKENSRDMLRRGRIDRRDGEHQHNSKLSFAQVEQIRAEMRRLERPGRPRRRGDVKALAARFAVNRSVLSRVSRNLVRVHS